MDVVSLPTREFVEFPKISRLKRDVVITEKIDGTNLAVVITDDLDCYAQSRTRVITPKEDNHGFARWVSENAPALIEQLGPGRHFGEWWGSGIQRGYGLTKGEKRFSLFNVGRWHGSPVDGWRCIEAPICFVVPTLEVCEFNSTRIDSVLANLKESGSSAAPGFMNPEGIVIFHTQNQSLFKMTFEYDIEGKGKAFA